jgi:hypothetical protein
MSKRGDGIFKKILSSGEIRYFFRTPEADGRPQGYHQFYTRKEAKDAKREIDTQIKKHQYVVPAQIPLFSVAAEDWFTNKTNTVSRSGRPRDESTLGQWRSHLDLHLVPVIGHYKVSVINLNLAEIIRDEIKKRSGVSNKQVNKILTTASSVMKGQVGRTIAQIPLRLLIVYPMNGAETMWRKIQLLPSHRCMRQLRFLLLSMLPTSNTPGPSCISSARPECATVKLWDSNGRTFLSRTRNSSSYTHFDPRQRDRKSTDSFSNAIYGASSPDLHFSESIALTNDA